MAKGLNLTDTIIREFYLVVRNGDAEVRYLGEIYDEDGNYIKSENVSLLFSQFPNQIRAALNAAMRLVSQEFNRDKVAEDSETWVDI